MPIYEFRCQRCDERFELRRPMRDADAPATCALGHAEVTRLLRRRLRPGVSPRRRA